LSRASPRGLSDRLSPVTPGTLRRELPPGRGATCIPRRNDAKSMPRRVLPLH